MINISKPSRCIHRIFMLSFQLNKPTKRNYSAQLKEFLYFQNKPTKRNYSAQLKEFDQQSYLNKKVKKGTLGGIAYFTLFVPVTCFALAIWQIYRLRWKNELCRLLAERTKLPAVELPEDLTDRKKLEYRRVKVRGTFDHSREMFLGPRSKIVDNKFAASVPLIFPSLGGKPETNIGTCVITPFKVAGRDVEILVNRGWIQNERRDPALRADGQIEGEIELEGIVRLKEEKPSHISEDRRRKLFAYRDIQAMAEMAGTTHFYIDATADHSTPGGPIGGQTQVNLRNDHFNYICTWYGNLCVKTGGLFLGSYTAWMWHKRWILKLH